MGRYRVLLATSTSWLSFSRMPRLLDIAGCDIDVMSAPNSLVSQRKFIRKRFFVDGGPGAIATRLISHLHEQKPAYDWVFIGDDALFSAVAELGDESLDQWFPSRRDESSLQFFTSKIAFMKRCAEHGFSIAPYRLCDSMTAGQEAAAHFGYPVVIKVAESIGGSGVTRVDTPEELQTHLATITGEFAVQRFAAGRQIIAEVLFDRGRPRCWMTSELLNRWPRRLGPCTVRKLIDVPKMGETLERIGALTNFHGFASVDSILPDDGGPPMLSEMNPRTTTGYHFDPQVRLEFAKAIRDMLSGKPVGNYTPLPAHGRTAALFPEAFYYLTSGPLDWERWKHAFDSLCRMPIDDPWYLMQMAKDFRHFVQGEVQKKYSSPTQK